MNYLERVLELTKLTISYQNDGLGTAFINFSGHVHGVDIRLFKGEWTGEDKDIQDGVMLYLDGDNFNEKKYLKTIIWLQNCLLKKELLSSEFIHQK